MNQNRSILSAAIGAEFTSGTFNSTGLFYSSFNPSQLNQRSFADTILRLFPNGTAPLFGFTGRLPKAVAKSTTHGYFTKSMAFVTIQLNDATDMAAGDTVMVVDSTAGVVPGMTFQTPLREIIRVVTVDSATQLTISRSHGRVAAGVILDNEICFAVGNSQTQASNRPVTRTMATVFVPNYTVIIRNSWAISDTASKELAEAGFVNIQETRQDAMLLHATDIESNLFWGQANAPAGTPPIHATQGIIDAVYQYAAGNVKTAGATTNYTQLVSMFEPSFAVTSNMANSKERIFFGDSTAIKVINDVGRLSGQVQIELRETTFGLSFTAFRFYKGMIFLIEHPLFNGLLPAANAGFGVTVELGSLRVAYLGDRDVKVEEYGEGKNQDSGIDADGGSLTTEFATEFKNPAAYGVINGLTAGAA